MSDEVRIIKIVVQKATDGRDYVQIGDPVFLETNIVLIADRIEVEDER